MKSKMKSTVLCLFVALALGAAAATKARAQSQGAPGPFKPAPPAASAGGSSSDSPSTQEKKKAASPAPAPVSPPAPAPSPSAAPPSSSSTLPAASAAYPPPPAPPSAAAPPAPGSPGANAPGAPPAGYPPAGYPPAGYPQPGAPYGAAPAPGYPPGYPPYGYPPPGPGYPYPGYPPYQGYPNAYYPYAPPQKSPGAHTHDGFYLRMGLGVGGLSLSMDNSGTKTEIGGTSLGVAFAFGAALTRHLIIYGEFFTVGTSDPNVKVNGQSRTLATANASLFGIGPGVTYYFGESNFYLSSTLAFSQLTFSGALEDNRAQSDTNWGATLKISAGKEWWASDNWGLGIAAQLALGSMKDDHLTVQESSSTPAWNVGALTLLFSATYN
ncbi:MAG TPA: hypothetical protein VNO55_08325 [Polyangia bacterium]|nr:hypothetical protein [Polyangia bacterium]